MPPPASSICALVLWFCRADWMALQKSEVKTHHSGELLLRTENKKYFMSIKNQLLESRQYFS
jgi:hypothetical protein